MYLTFIPNYHRQKCSEFTLFPRVVILWKGTGSAKFPHQEIRRNFAILHSVSYINTTQK